RVLKADLDAVDQDKRKSVSCIAYGKADGMESTLCNGVAQPAAWKTSDGRLWFPTTKGLVAVDPNIEVVRNPSPVYIEQVLADKRRMSTSTGERANAQSADSLTRSLTLPPGRGELEFRFTALNFKAPEKSLFKYKLDGVDSEWVAAGTR